MEIAREGLSTSYHYGTYVHNILQVDIQTILSFRFTDELSRLAHDNACFGFHI